MSISRIAVLLLMGSAVSGAAQTAGSSAPPLSGVSASAAAPDANAARARAALNAMVQALGGERWLNTQNSFTEGRIAAFFEGKPTGVDVLYWQWQTPDAMRMDLTEGKHDKQNWVQIFSGHQCWEITFRGARPMQKDTCAAANRLQDHSIEKAVKIWMKNPATMLTYDGQSLAERHLAEQVTLLSADNDTITIQMDAQTHLPLSCSWTWRDPVYHDKNVDAEEFDDYHTIDGLPTPFTLTRVHNGDTTQQRFVLKAAYNVPLPEDEFDVDAIAAKVHH